MPRGTGGGCLNNPSIQGIGWEQSSACIGSAFWLIGFVLFCTYLAVTFPVTALYVVLAVLHAPIHVLLLRQLLAAQFVRNRSPRTIALAGALSGVLSLALVSVVATVGFSVARNLF